MNKPLKNKPIGARITVEQKEDIDQYLAASPEMSLGQLIRYSITEYMWGHPIKDNFKERN